MRLSADISRLSGVDSSGVDGGGDDDLTSATFPSLFTGQSSFMQERPFSFVSHNATSMHTLQVRHRAHKHIVRTHAMWMCGVRCRYWRLILCTV